MCENTIQNLQWKLKQFGYNQSTAPEDKDINLSFSIWKRMIMKATFFWDAVYCMSCYLCFITTREGKTLNQSSS